MKPIVKWAGGKRWLLDAIEPRLPRKIGTYVEPFAGGAALFFHLAGEDPPRYERAILCDANAELMACYRAVKKNVEAVIRVLRKKYDRHDEALFYAARELDPAGLSDAERAARLIFLNRTCYNGLWRVNSRGQFNVPFGRYKNPTICQPERLRAAAGALGRVTLHTGDFARATRALQPNDFVYFDPPYVPASKTADFTAYARRGFGPADQARLAVELRRLAAAGVGVLLSNADTRESRALYAGLELHALEAPRAISRDVTRRAPARELLVTRGA